MWTSYFNVALRNLRKHAGFSAINIVGLSVSMAVCLLILAFAWDQARYDDFHAKGSRIVRVLTDQLNAQGEVESSFAASPAPLAAALEQEVPGIEATTRIGQIRTMAIRDGNGVPVEGLFAEPSFFELFDFRLAKGNSQRVLGQPGQLILAPETAQRIFGEQEPIGQTLTLEGLGEYTVGGIAAPLPGKTHLQFELLVSFISQHTTGRADELTNWDNRWNFATYLLLQDAAVIPRLQRVLDAIAERQYGGTEEPMQFRVQALGNIALGPVLGNEIASYSVPAIVVCFLAVLAGVIMLAAGFNYVSLSVARSLRRASEIGVRKAMGAGRVQVIGQLIGEAVIMALLALGGALALLMWLLPAFNGLTFVQMGEAGVPLNRLFDPQLLGLFVAFSVLVGVLAGLYPALRLSRFQPVSVLRGMRDMRGFSGRRLRHALTGIQFAVALFFVVTAALLYLQFRYLVTADYGFAEERVLTVALQNQPFDVLEEELARQPGVQRVAAASQLPASGSTSRIAVSRTGMDEPTAFYEYAVSPGFIESLGLQMVAGRSFSNAIGSDSAEAVVLNERAVRALGFARAEQALGTVLDLSNFERPAQVIGVVRDYHYSLMVDPIEPMLLHYTPSAFRYAVLQVAPDAMDAVVTHVEAVWAQLAPVHPPRVAPLANQLSENPINRILHDVTRVIGSITLLAVFISCLGLLGMALYNVETRRREVGVRKVLGATHRSLMLLLSRDMLRVVGLACVVVLPLAWLAGRLWLQAFAHRIDVSLGLLAGCAVLMIGLAMGVIATQTVRAVRTDPARVLQTE